MKNRPLPLLRPGLALATLAALVAFAPLPAAAQTLEEIKTAQAAQAAQSPQAASSTGTLLSAPEPREPDYVGGYGRFTLWGMGGSRSYEGGYPSTSYSEVTGAVTYRSGEAVHGGVEWAADMRGSWYPSGTGDSTRFSLYEAWVGGTTKNGALAGRVGQIWINDLGGIGSVGGVQLEYRVPIPRRKNGKNGKKNGAVPEKRLRFGLFGGLEPKWFDVGYASGVRKGGVYASYDGGGAWRNTVGWVVIRNEGLTERSVLSTTNFLPIGPKVFVYQAAEYDLVAPAGQGSAAGLTYFFTNARWSPSRQVEVQGLYHRGLSIDSRSISTDVLAGRPVDSKQLEGFRFESYGGRVTVEVIPRLRLYAGYAQDRDNRDSKAYGRITAGLWASNVFGSGVDLTVSDNRMQRPTGDYDAWYASIGRNIGRQVYVSFDYSTSLSVLRLTDSGGVTVESRPHTRRFGLSANANLSRKFSLMLTAERFDDDYTTDYRGLFGINYRFY